MATFPDSMSEEKWSKEEKENLGKGVKQQFQGMLLQRSVELFRFVSWSVHDAYNGNMWAFYAYVMHIQPYLNFKKTVMAWSGVLITLTMVSSSLLFCFRSFHCKKLNRIDEHNKSLDLKWSYLS